MDWRRLLLGAGAGEPLHGMGLPLASDRRRGGRRLQTAGQLLGLSLGLLGLRRRHGSPFLIPSLIVRADASTPEPLAPAACTVCCRPGSQAQTWLQLRHAEVSAPLGPTLGAPAGRSSGPGPVGANVDVVGEPSPLSPRKGH